MKLRKKDEKNFIKVGLFISALTAILMVMIVSIGKENSFFESTVEMKAHVDNVKNLKPGSYVELKGIRVGSVHDIEILGEENVEIRFTMLESQLKWIKQDSKVSISTAGLVGDKYLEIYDGTKASNGFNPEKDVLQSENLADMKQIMTKGESIATITERILSRLDQIIFNMDDGRKLIETVNSLSKASQNVEKITQELRDAQLGQTVKNVNLSMARLEKASGSIERIMARIESGPGTMNALIYDDSLHESLRALLGGASRNKVIKYFIRESIEDSERKKSKTDE
jgi:phospholipid/cholesterol/gamma-HCH transport system substrate-binding protein